MAAGSAGSAGSAGNAYVVHTDSPFQTDNFLQDYLFKKTFGKDNYALRLEVQELQKEVQGLKTQKQTLLNSIRQLTETALQLQHVDGRKQYTQDYEYLHALYDKAKYDALTYSNNAKTENNAYNKLLEAYNLVMKAYRHLWSNSVASTDLKHQLQSQIAIAESVAKEAKEMKST